MTKFFVSNPVNENLLQVMKKYSGMERVYNRTEADLGIYYFPYGIILIQIIIIWEFIN